MSALSTEISDGALDAILLHFQWEDDPAMQVGHAAINEQLRIKLREILAPFNPPPTDRLTEMKTRSILERDYKLSGYVVMNALGERAIIEMSAVRWLSNAAMWDLMHPPGPSEKICTCKTGESCSVCDPGG